MTDSIPTIQPLGKLYLNDSKTAWLDLDRDDPIYHRVFADDLRLPVVSLYVDKKMLTLQQAIHSRIQPNQMVFNIGARYYAIPAYTPEFFADDKHFRQCKSLPNIYMTKCQKVFAKMQKPKSLNYHEVTPHITSNGYKRCKFGDKNWMVHRLMMDAWHPTFKITTDWKDAVVDHIDANRSNNDLSNLQVVSCSENIQLGYDRRSIINSSLDICETIESATDIIWD